MSDEVKAIYSRDAGCGYAVAIVSATPTAVRLAVTAEGGKIVLDAFDVPREKGLEALHHTALFSELYAEALR